MAASQAILEKYPESKSQMKVSYVDEKTHNVVTINLPTEATIADIKAQARESFDYSLPDNLCAPGHIMRLVYPDDGYDAELSLKLKRGKRGHTKGLHDLKDDQSAWVEATQHWAKGGALRRDKALVKYTNEVCWAVRRTPPPVSIPLAGGAGGGATGPTHHHHHQPHQPPDSTSAEEPAEARHVLGAARRLCSIVGVPVNVAALARLKKMYLIDQAVLDLINFREERHPKKGGATLEGGGEGGGGGGGGAPVLAAAAAGPVAAVTAPGGGGLELDLHVPCTLPAAAAATAASDNCEPLSIACGAHLHWFVAGISSRYFREKCVGLPIDPLALDAPGVPPKYEPFLRMVAMKLNPAMVRKQMRKAGLDLSVLGLLESDDNNTTTNNNSRKQSIKAAAATSAVAIPDAVTMGPLMSSLRKAVGAIRHRQLEVVGVWEGKRAVEEARREAAQMQARAEAEAEAAAAAEAAAHSPIYDAKARMRAAESLSDGNDSYDSFDGSTTTTGSHQGAGVGGGDGGQAARFTNDEGGDDDESSSLGSLESDGQTGVFRDSIGGGGGGGGGTGIGGGGCDPNGEGSSSGLGHVFDTDLSHEEWEACDSEALDLAAFTCLGAVWCNLRSNHAQRQRHGKEVLAYALLLAVHGGAAVGTGRQGGGGGGASEPTSPKSPKSSGPLSVAAAGLGGRKGGGKEQAAPLQPPPLPALEPVPLRSLALHVLCHLLSLDPHLRADVSAQLQSSVAGSGGAGVGVTWLRDLGLLEVGGGAAALVEKAAEQVVVVMKQRKKKATGEDNGGDDSAAPDDDDNGSPAPAEAVEEPSSPPSSPPVAAAAKKSGGASVALLTTTTPVVAPFPFSGGGGGGGSALPGLARLLWSADPGTCLCAATALASCITDPSNRRRISKAAAFRCLPAALSFALRVRHEQQRQQRQEQEQEQQQQEQQQQSATSSSSIFSRYHHSAKGHSIGAGSSGGGDALTRALRGPDGSWAADACDHSLVAVWGLMLVLHGGGLGDVDEVENGDDEHDGEEEEKGGEVREGSPTAALQWLVDQGPFLDLAPPPEEELPSDLLHPTPFNLATKMKKKKTTTAPSHGSSGVSAMEEEEDGELDTRPLGLVDAILLLCRWLDPSNGLPPSNPHMSTENPTTALHHRAASIWMQGEATTTTGNAPSSRLLKTASVTTRGGYGPLLSELEVRCSASCLAILASVDPVGVAGRLEEQGLETLLSLAELEPEEEEEDDDNEEGDDDDDVDEEKKDEEPANEKGDGDNVGDARREEGRKGARRRAVGGSSNVLGRRSLLAQEAAMECMAQLAVASSTGTARGKAAHAASLDREAVILARLGREKKEHLHCGNHVRRSVAVASSSAPSMTEEGEEEGGGGNTQPLFRHQNQNQQQQQQKQQQQAPTTTATSLTLAKRAVTGLGVLVDGKHAVERVAALRIALVLRARRAAKRESRKSSSLSVTAPSSSAPTAARADALIDDDHDDDDDAGGDAAGAEAAGEAVAAAAAVKAGLRRRWTAVKAASVATMHFTSLANEQQLQAELQKAEKDKELREVAAAEAEAAVAEAKRNRRRAQKKRDKQKGPDGGEGAMSPLLKKKGPALFSSTALATTTAGSGGAGGAKAAAAVLAGGAGVGGLKSLLGNAIGTMGIRQGGNAARFGSLVQQVRTRLIFSRKRLVCVAQQLWSENRAVATQGAASLWMLSRDPSTRHALAVLCLDTEQAVGLQQVASKALLKAQSARKQADDAAKNLQEERQARKEAGAKVTATAVKAESDALQRQVIVALDAENVSHKAEAASLHAVEGAAGLPPIVARLLELSLNSPDDVLRGWALAAIAALAQEPTVREQDCVEMVGSLTRLLTLYAAQAGAGSAGEGNSSGGSNGGGGGGGGITGNRPAAAAAPAVVKPDPADKFGRKDPYNRSRLTSSSIHTLLVLAYHHKPALDALREPMPPPPPPPPQLSKQPEKEEEQQKHHSGDKKEAAFTANDIGGERMSVEAALLLVAREPRCVRRTRREACHLLLLLCAEDMDESLSKEVDPSSAANKTEGSSSSSGSGSESWDGARLLLLPSLQTTNTFAAVAAVAAASASLPPLPSLIHRSPLQRLQHAASTLFLATYHQHRNQHRPSSSHGDDEEERTRMGAAASAAGKYVLEDLFLDILAEQLDDDDDDDDVGHEGTCLDDHANAQAHAFGFVGPFQSATTTSSSLSSSSSGHAFVGSGDGDDAVKERTSLLRLCLNGLSDLAARRSGAQARIVQRGGAALCVRLTCMANKQDDKLEATASLAAAASAHFSELDSRASSLETQAEAAAKLKSLEAVKIAAAASDARAQADEAQAQIPASVVEEDPGGVSLHDPEFDDAGKTMPTTWRFTMPLHLLFNLSVCPVEDASEKLCGQALNALLLATVPLSEKPWPGTKWARLQGRGAEEKWSSARTLGKQLAFATLANLSRSPTCRALVYRRALAAGLVPPGARDMEKVKRKSAHAEKLEDVASATAASVAAGLQKKKLPKAAARARKMQQVSCRAESQLTKKFLHSDNDQPNGGVGGGPLDSEAATADAALAVAGQQHDSLPPGLNDEVGKEHVRAVHDWMFMAFRRDGHVPTALHPKVPDGAPRRLRIPTNLPLALPPTAPTAVTMSPKTTMTPLLEVAASGTASAAVVVEGAAPLLPPVLVPTTTSVAVAPSPRAAVDTDEARLFHAFAGVSREAPTGDADTFLLPGASSTRTRTARRGGGGAASTKKQGGVGSNSSGVGQASGTKSKTPTSSAGGAAASLLPENRFYPLGSDAWHPDLANGQVVGGSGDDDDDGNGNDNGTGRRFVRTSGALENNPSVVASLAGNPLVKPPPPLALALNPTVRASNHFSFSPIPLSEAPLPDAAPPLTAAAAAVKAMEQKRVADKERAIEVATNELIGVTSSSSSSSSSPIFSSSLSLPASSSSSSLAASATAKLEAVSVVTVEEVEGGGGGVGAESVSDTSGVQQQQGVLPEPGLETMTAAAASTAGGGSVGGKKQLMSLAVAMNQVLDDDPDAPHNLAFDPAYAWSKRSQATSTEHHRSSASRAVRAKARKGQQQRKPSAVCAWTHVPGSVVGREAGLVPFQVHDPTADSSASNGGGDKGAAAGASSAAAGHDVDPLPGQSSLVSSSESSAQARSFYMHARGVPAQPFAPPPLPPPLPPIKRSDVFQRKLPQDNDGSAVGEADLLPLVGGWARGGAAEAVVEENRDLALADSLGVDDNSSVALSVASSQSAATAASSIVNNNTSSSSSSSKSKSLHGPLAAWAAPPPMPWRYSTFPSGHALDTTEALVREALKTGGGMVASKKSSSSLPSALLPWWGCLYDPSMGLGRAPHNELGVETDSPYAPLRGLMVGGGGGSDNRLVFGGMPEQHLTLLVRAPIPKPPAAAVAAEPELVVGPAWDYQLESIFRPRGKVKGASLLDRSSLADAKSMHDNEPSNSDAAFESDWAKCVLKKERFFNLIKRGVGASGGLEEGGGGAYDPEVAALKAVLRKHYDWLMYIFLVHSANDVEATHACYMGWLSYSALMEKAAITDEGSDTCQTRDLDIVFKAANFEVKGSDPKDDNPLESLTRQEWLEIVIRVAKAKFGGSTGAGAGGGGSVVARRRSKAATSAVVVASGKASKGGGARSGGKEGGKRASVRGSIAASGGGGGTEGGGASTMAESVDLLVCHMQEHLKRDALANEFEAEASDLRDQWRRTEFYTVDTDGVYRRWRPRLEALYREKVDAKNVGTHNMWSLRQWLDLLQDSLLLEDESFTFEEANLCFYLSKFTVFDYQQDVNRHECLDWLSFLEALGHIARFKDMPRRQDLISHGFPSGTLPELIEGLRASNTSWDEWMAAHPPVEDFKGEPPFHVRLESLLSLLFFMLDTLPKKPPADESKGSKKKGK